jgi:O-acetyl-ADP-ribose deacetylase (regulator of RNase III)
VLVSSDDASLSMGGGVSAALARAAGPQIRIDTVKRTPAKVGDVILSSAGKLSAKYIFHAVTLGADTMSHDEVVRKVTHRSISLLPLLGLSSIAFPAIGSGLAGFTLETVASTMADVIVNELRSSQMPLDVTIYLFDRFGKMQEIDYLKFFEEVAVRTWALNNTVAVSSLAPRPAVNLTPGVQRVLEPDAAQPHTVDVKKSFFSLILRT